MSSTNKKNILIFFILISLINIVYAEQKIYPIDEAYKDANFLTFRTKLIRAIQRKNIKFIQNSFSDKTKMGSNMDSQTVNKDKLVKEYINNSNAPFSRKWLNALLDALIHGGYFEKNTFIAPYYWRNREKKYDEYSAIIIDKNVNLREKPNTNSKVIKKISYEEVFFLNYQGEWRKIYISNNKYAYVNKKFIRRLAGNFIVKFKKIKGKWKIFLFQNMGL